MSDPMMLKADDGNFVWFERLPVENKLKSQAAGRPIHEEVVYVSVQGPGKRDCPRFRYEGQYVERYGKQFDLWQQKEKGDGYTEGTSLDMVPFITRAMAADLRALKIHTAEVLAAVDDNTVSRLGPGGRQLRDQAKAYLEQAAGAAPITRLTADLERKDDEIGDLRKRIAGLEDLLHKLGKQKDKAA